MRKKAVGADWGYVGGILSSRAKRPEEKGVPSAPVRRMERVVRSEKESSFEGSNR